MDIRDESFARAELCFGHLLDLEVTLEADTDASLVAVLGNTMRADLVDRSALVDRAVLADVEVIPYAAPALVYVRRVYLLGREAAYRADMVQHDKVGCVSV